MNTQKKLLPVLIGLFLFTACEKYNSQDDKLPLRINTLIHECLSTFYQWNHQMPNLSPEAANNPNKYFQQLLYCNDKWSLITDNAEKLMAELSGTGETFGYHLAYCQFKNCDQRFAVVQYIYPGTPAHESLQRGAIFIQINGQYITEKDFSKFHQYITITLGVAKLQDNTITSVQKNVTLKSKIIDTDPVLGLMYNHGGDFEAAIFLYRTIAPKNKAIKGALLSKEQWNPECQQVFEQDPQHDSFLNQYFVKVNCNLNLLSENVYILTSHKTISASEYTTICLKASMDVTLEGIQTYRKYFTMYPFSPQIEKDREMFPDEGLSNWLLLPVYSRYTNINGTPNTTEVLLPNIEIEDDLLTT